MAINVNDGTAKWQLIKYSEADTLGGLTASEIKSQAISGKTVQVKGQYGAVTFSTKGTRSYTIPLPSGYSRTQCAYIISEGYVETGSDSSVYASIQTKWNSVNQSTGLISPTIGGKSPDYYNVSLLVQYLIIAAK